MERETPETGKEQYVIKYWAEYKQMWENERMLSAYRKPGMG